MAKMSVETSTLLPSTQEDMGTYADSQATSHFICCKDAIFTSSFHEVIGRITLLADNTSVTATQKGDMILPFANANLWFMDAILFPHLDYTLVSVGRLAYMGINYLFCATDMRLIPRERLAIGCRKYKKTSGWYPLPKPGLC